MYIRMASPIWRILLEHIVCRADSRAWEKTGKRMAARIAIMAMTTRSSMRVKAVLGVGSWVLGIRRRRCMGVLLFAESAGASRRNPVLLVGFSFLPYVCLHSLK